MTPQEAYDEDKRLNPTTKKDDVFGCLMTILYLGIIFLIFYFL